MIGSGFVWEDVSAWIGLGAMPGGWQETVAFCAPTAPESLVHLARVICRSSAVSVQWALGVLVPDGHLLAGRQLSVTLHSFSK